MSNLIIRFSLYLEDEMFPLFVCNGLIIFSAGQHLLKFFFILITNTFRSLKEICAGFFFKVKIQISITDKDVLKTQNVINKFKPKNHSFFLLHRLVN